MPESKLARNAIGVGLCALIPLPWIDELAKRALLRSSFRDLGLTLARPLPSAVVSTLAEDRTSLLLGCLVALVWWPIKKIFRTILYFLTIKDLLDWMCEAALRGEMVRMALSRGLLPERAAEVRDAMDAVIEAHTASPVTRVLLRHPRPPVIWPAGSSQVYGLLGNLVAQAGGGKMLPAFEARCDQLLAAR